MRFASQKNSLSSKIRKVLIGKTIEAKLSVTLNFAFKKFQKISKNIQKIFKKYSKNFQKYLKNIQKYTENIQKNFENFYKFS